jgi:hypothetical protein
MLKPPAMTAPQRVRVELAATPGRAIGRGNLPDVAADPQAMLPEPAVAGAAPPAAPAHDD